MQAPDTTGADEETVASAPPAHHLMGKEPAAKKPSKGTSRDSDSDFCCFRRGGKTKVRQASKADAGKKMPPTLSGAMSELGLTAADQRKLKEDGIGAPKTRCLQPHVCCTARACSLKCYSFMLRQPLNELEASTNVF